MIPECRSNSNAWILSDVASKAMTKVYYFDYTKLNKIFMITIMLNIIKEIIGKMRTNE